MFDRSKWWFEEKVDNINNWEYIPAMSKIRLNEINDELKAQGFKCPEIRDELEYRNTSKVNNIVLETSDIDFDKESMSDTTQLELRHPLPLTSNVAIFNPNYSSVDVDVDDLYTPSDILYSNKEEINSSDINILEEEFRFKFNKQ